MAMTLIQSKCDAHFAVEELTKAANLGERSKNGQDEILLFRDGTTHWREVSATTVAASRLYAVLALHKVCLIFVKLHVFHGKFVR
jgi:hypothetical protein